MLFLLLLLPLWIAPLSALSLPSKPSIIKLPTTNSTTISLQDLTEWPKLPWALQIPNSDLGIQFIAYGRRASIELTRQIIGNLDVLILRLLNWPQRYFGIEPFRSAYGIVGVAVIFDKTGVRPTIVAAVLKQIRDLMGFGLGPREITQANIWTAGIGTSLATMGVGFGQVS